RRVAVPCRRWRAAELVGVGAWWSSVLLLFEGVGEGGVGGCRAALFPQMVEQPSGEVVAGFLVSDSCPAWTADVAVAHLLSSCCCLVRRCWSASSSSRTARAAFRFGWSRIRAMWAVAMSWLLSCDAPWWGCVLLMGCRCPSLSSTYLVPRQRVVQVPVIGGPSAVICCFADQ